MTTGILVVDKPKEWTSHDVVAKLRGVFHEKRIGHAGTLDPMATGVLPVFLGRATRVVEFATESKKEYVAGITFGITTDTQDSTGNILKETPCCITREDLEKVLPQFRGDISQIPPMYSAIKIQGKKLYELARKGKEIERPARPVTIHELELLPDSSEKNTFSLRIQCSKGTYVRTICHDIGILLGSGAVMSSLRRTEAAGFSLTQAYTMDEIMEKSHDLLLPVDSYFSQDKFVITPKQEVKLRNGTTFSLLETQTIPHGEYRIYSESGAFLSVSKVENGKVETIKSFFEVEPSEKK